MHTPARFSYSALTHANYGSMRRPTDVHLSALQSLIDVSLPYKSSYGAVWAAAMGARMMPLLLLSERSGKT